MKRILPFAIAVLWLLAAAADATTLQRMTLDELAAAAPAVARVRVVSGESRIEGGRIWTFTQMDVVESFKGALPARITVRLLGGHVPGLVSKVEGIPRFSPGEETILFLQPSRAGGWTVVSWVQGTFRIDTSRRKGAEQVTQDTAAVVVFDPATRKFETGGVRQMPLADFKVRLLRAIIRSEGSGP